MTGCAEIRPRIALYIDSELSGAEMLELEAHLTDCAECRRAFGELRETADAVRGAGPLYEVPEGSYGLAERTVGEWVRRDRHRRRLPLAIAAMGLAVAAGAGWLFLSRSAYESFAVETHLNYTRGALPLDIASNQPQRVSDWLGPRVPFHMMLPNYPEGGPKRYALVGARLMQFHGESVAFLAYEMDRKPISLLISSSGRVIPVGEESYRSGGLTFYFSSQRGLRVITWTDKGLTYAQVSNLEVKGAESCAICHGAEGERPKFEELRKTI